MSDMITTQDKMVDEIVQRAESMRTMAREARPDIWTSLKERTQYYKSLSDGEWKGRRCFIIGGGQSLKGFDFSRLRNELTIAVNRSFEYLEPSAIFFMDYVSFYLPLMDGKFGDMARNKFIESKAIKIALNISGYEYPLEIFSVNSADSKNMTFSLNNGLGHGDNSGYGALNLAVCLGANPIYLLGFDMKGDGKGNQAWFHEGYKSNQGESVYNKFLESFKYAAPILEKAGIEVVNLNLDSALRCFKFGQFDKIKGIPEMEISQSRLISVVMPTYNQGKYIKQAIESILEQTHRDFELIIVNDGSTDDTEKIIKSFSDKRIKYIKKKNGGTGSALNEGFRIASGRYETWFSSDSVMYPNCLEVLSKNLDESSEGFVYGRSDVMDKDGKLKGPLAVKPFDRELLLKTCYLGIAYMWKKDLRFKAGNDYAETPSEDFDMYLRMSEIADFKHIPIALAGWRDHPENLTQTTTLPSGWKDHYRFIDEAKRRRKNPFFTVMIVTRNRPELLKEALESLSKQTFGSFEVLIISISNNSAVDKEVVKSFGDARFKWMRPSKLPVYTVRNKMIDQAKGRYITVLDDDDLFPENALKDRYEFILKNHAPDFIYSDYMRFGTAMESVYYKTEPLTADFILDHKGTKSKMIGANLTVWRPILKEMKYDDVTFPDNVSDCDLAIRLLKANLRFGVLNKMTYMYRAHPGQISYFVNKDFNQVIDLWKKIYKKHGRTWK